MATESGYNNQKKIGTSQFKTIQELGSGVYGAPVVQKSVFDVSAAQAIVSVTPVYVNGQIQAYDLELTAHGVVSSSGIIRFTTGVLTGWEAPIESVVSVDILRVLAIFPSAPAVGAFCKPMGWVTPKSDSDGNLSFSPGPVQIVKNGLTVQIAKDTVDPNNTIGMPVEIVAASGSPINITAGDLNVQMTDLGANFDSFRLGDGSGDYASISTNSDTTKALSVKDKDATTALGSLLTELQLKADLSETQPVSVASLPLPSGAATETTLGSIDTKTPALVSGRVPVDGSGVTQPISAASLPLPTGAATETTLSALNNKHNADFGASSGAIRTAAQLGNATGAADFNAGADSAQTLRVSANLKRAGNELSYNSGVVDANTLRVVLPSDFVPNAAAALTGSYQEIVNLTNVAQTFTAPANAKWCKIQADDQNSTTIRVKIGAAATVSSGLQFQPGRSEDYQIAGNISVIAETAVSNQKIYVQFGV